MTLDDKVRVYVYSAVQVVTGAGLHAWLGWWAVLVNALYWLAWIAVDIRRAASAERQG
jgi:hypothetical protein